MKRIRLITCSVALLSILLPAASAHGSKDEQVTISTDADWATRHMIEEHHIGSFDAGVFFNLHDYDSSGQWSPEDIRRTYGLYDPSTNSVPEDKKASIVQTILDLYDVDHSGTISYQEFVLGWAHGKTLPDFGTGPGHHGDDEYEYEIHHFEKFHGDGDVKDEDLTHPEDIAHFKMHERMEKEQEEWEKRSAEGIVEANIPAKFRRSP